MSDVQIFNHNDFGRMRVVTINGDPWLVGKDVAQALGYVKPENALAAHVDEEDKTSTLIQGIGSNYKSKAIIINESGLYSLVLSSKLPGAKKFKRWVTTEVLPSIRKNGGYIAGQNDMTDAELMARAVLVAQKAIEERDLRIARLTEQVDQMRPQALFANSVAASDQCILVGELAKILRQNGVDMGEKRLFAWMRDEGYLIKRRGADWNMPTQRSMEMGLFRIKETVISHSDGHTTINKTPKVTGKGQQYFINKFLGTK